MLNRLAFGDEASTYRHGGVHPRVDARAQCLVWLLGIASWLDAYGIVLRVARQIALIAATCAAPCAAPDGFQMTLLEPT
jgi:hypothetical protein